MRDYAKGRIAISPFSGLPNLRLRGGKKAIWAANEESIALCIREACAEAYADGRKAERRRVSRMIRSSSMAMAHPGNAKVLIERINHNPKRRGGK